MKTLIPILLSACSLLGQTSSETATATGKTYVFGSNWVSTAGGSVSNLSFGGRYFLNTSSFTNLNAAGTLSNLANVPVAASLFMNVGDILLCEWGGTMPSALANTNQFQIVYGSTTILDTGLQTASNTTFFAQLRLTRTGTTAQHADARFFWGPGGGVPFAFTNVNLELVETNNIATIIALKGGSRRVGAMTNNYFGVFKQ